MTDNGESLLGKKQVQRLFDKETWKKLDAYHAPRQIIVACDPNMMSTEGSSEMALVSLVRVDGHIVVRTFFVISPFLLGPPPPVEEAEGAGAGK